MGVMETKIVKITDCLSDAEKIRAAAEIIKEGGLVAFPTETVYGLGADARNADAVRKIYQAKGRPADNPLITHIADFADIEQITSGVPEKAARLNEAFWPGPLTMILKKSALVPYATTAGLETVSIRMPNHPAALALIRESGGYIAAPSANASGRPSPTLAKHVAEDFDGRIPLILDGGPVGIGIESTILDLTEEVPTILRPGAVTRDMLESVIGEVRMDPGILSPDSTRKPKAPGMKYRHYAPRADLTVVDGAAADVAARINELAAQNISQRKKVGIICTDETYARYSQGQVVSIGARSDEETIARHLYKILRDFDETDVDVIYSESFAAPGIGEAIMNRLLKAAGHQVIHV